MAHDCRPAPATPLSDAAVLLDDRLVERFADLSPTEQRVARFFSDHREEIGFASALEIAQRLGTSDATVVRTAQRLGYAGLPDLKRRLVAALRAGGTHAAPLGRSLEETGETPAAILERVIAWHIQLLEEARATLSSDPFARALELLHAAHRTVTFGSGPSATLAEHMTLELTRIGLRAASITASGLALADALLALQRDDALILMDCGPERAREVEVALDHARSLGVRAIMLTAEPPPEFAARVEVVLQAPRGQPGRIGNLVSTTVVLDALLLGLANCERSPSQATRQLLNDLQAQIVGRRVDVDARLREKTSA